MPNSIRMRTNKQIAEALLKLMNAKDVLEICITEITDTLDHSTPEMIKHSFTQEIWASPTLEDQCNEFYDKANKATETTAKSAKCWLLISSDEKWRLDDLHLSLKSQLDRIRKRGFWREDEYMVDQGYM